MISKPTKLTAVALLVLMMAGCTTTTVVSKTNIAATNAGMTRHAATEKNPSVPVTQTVPEPVEPRTIRAEPVQSMPAQPKKVSPNMERKLAVLRIEAGALITEVNGDRKLACLSSGCDLSLPPGTYSFNVGHKNTETRTESGVTYASISSRVIEVKLEPGHSYSLTASGKNTPTWWIKIEDQTSNKTVYDDRSTSP